MLARVRRKLNCLPRLSTLWKEARYFPRAPAAAAAFRQIRYLDDAVLKGVDKDSVDAGVLCCGSISSPLSYTSSKHN